MKDYAWKIKISDLLTNPWNTDHIEFKNKFLQSEDIILWEKWISWKLFLQWLNHDEVLLKIENREFSNIFQCDKCLKKYEDIFKLKDLEEVRFVNTNNIKLEENIHDNIFPIDMKNQNIDISELIEIIVKNEEPIIKECEKCKNQETIEEEKNQEEISTYKIDFSKLLKS